MMREPVYLPNAAPFEFPGNHVGCLLLHGLTGTPYEVRELGERLSGAGYAVRGVCLPGHATRIQDLDGVTWEDWAGAVDAGWRGLAATCEHIFLMGISMGGSLALLSAARYPTAGVVGMAAMWQLPRYQTILTRLVAPFQPYQRKRRGSSILDEAAKAKHPTYQYMHLPAVLQFERLLVRMRAELPRVTAPALLLHSRHDPVAPPAGAPLILNALGSADKRLHWVERSAHIITEDFDKEEVFREVVAWVGERSRPSPPAPLPRVGRGK